MHPISPYQVANGGGVRPSTGCTWQIDPSGASLAHSLTMISPLLPLDLDLDHTLLQVPCEAGYGIHAAPLGVWSASYARAYPQIQPRPGTFQARAAG